jgi:histidinol phosphatase-like PHP family hydrolase
VRDTLGDIDVLVASNEPARVVEAFTSLGPVRQVLAAGDTRASVVTHAELQIDLRVVAAESFGAALQYFTGSKAHNVNLREIAIRKGYKLNEYGLFEGDLRLGGETEESIYQALGLAWIPPELRHSAFQKPASVQTARLLAAIHNPHVDIIGHPTGRLLGKRAGYEIDLPAVLDAAAKMGTALEVSGQPERLDLDADAVRAAVERGALLVLDTDAHEHSQLGDLMRYAVGTARRGWATREAVLNTRSYEKLQACLASRSASRV